VSYGIVITRVLYLFLIQAVEAIEVQVDEELILQNALAASAWRHRVLRLLDESPKPLLRILQRTLKEVIDKFLTPFIFLSPSNKNQHIFYIRFD
jgi:hypothetical protein